MVLVLFLIESGGSSEKVGGSNNVRCCCCLSDLGFADLNAELGALGASLSLSSSSMSQCVPKLSFLVESIYKIILKY